jgi:hypothetical protein
MSENVHSFHWLMYLPSIQQRDVQPWTMEEYMEKNSRITEWKKRVRCVLWHVSFGQICTELEACSISAPLAHGWTSLLVKVTINVLNRRAKIFILIPRYNTRESLQAAAWKFRLLYIKSSPRTVVMSWHFWDYEQEVCSCDTVCLKCRETMKNLEVSREIS